MRLSLSRATSIPQPFHVDEAAGAASIFGSLCASGWHTVSASMRALVDYREGLRAAARARGETPPPPGLGLGVRNLRWSAPVRPGDEIAFTFETLSARVTRRPEWGVVTGGMACVNQDGREVCSYTMLVADGPSAPSLNALGRLRHAHGRASGDEAAQANAVVRRVFVGLKADLDQRVGAIFLGLAGEGAQHSAAVGFARLPFGAAPRSERFDATD